MPGVPSFTPYIPLEGIKGTTHIRLFSSRYAERADLYTNDDMPVSLSSLFAFTRDIFSPDRNLKVCYLTMGNTSLSVPSTH